MKHILIEWVEPDGCHEQGLFDHSGYLDTVNEIVQAGGTIHMIRMTDLPPIPHR